MEDADMEERGEELRLHAGTASTEYGARQSETRKEDDSEEVDHVRRW